MIDLARVEQIELTEDRGDGRKNEAIRRNRQISQDLLDGEINLILASTNHPICSHKHVRRNRHTDLLGGLQVDHELTCDCPLTGSATSNMVSTKTAARHRSLDNAPRQYRTTRFRL